MFKNYAFLLPVYLVSLSMMLHADAPLKSALSLDTEQARTVDAIEAKYRPAFASKRQEHNFEDRKLRRARIANDSQQIAAQEKIVARLSGELKEIRIKEDDEIRRVLSPAQLTKFEEYLKLRKEMVGSSRDAKHF